jgi:mono/diheme cytochrome c family protein
MKSTFIDRDNQIGHSLAHFKTQFLRVTAELPSLYFRLFLMVIVVLSIFTSAFAASPDQNKSESSNSAVVSADSSKIQEDIARGRYLVDQVAMCGSCHTPTNEKGEPIKSRAMKGAKLSFKTMGAGDWADRAPNISGLPGWEDEAAIKFLMTGLAYNDLPARPPMPQFRMNHEDASAIVYYLRSLNVPRNASSKP